MSNAPSLHVITKMRYSAKLMMNVLVDMILSRLAMFKEENADPLMGKLRNLKPLRKLLNIHVHMLAKIQRFVTATVITAGPKISVIELITPHQPFPH